jgi:type I restriction enzyme S subunit
MEYKLEDIANVTMGQSPKSEFYNNDGDGMPFLQGNRTFGRRYPTFDTYTTKVTKKANAGDVIMSVRAPVGDLNITPIDMCLGRGVCGIRMKNDKQDFLFYLMKYNMLKLLNKQAGTVFGSVNRKDINGLIVEVPDEEIQDKIASFLGQIDQKIEVNEAINRNLEEQASTLFQKLIMDADGDAPLSEFITIKHGFAFKGKFISTEDNGVVLVTPGNFSIGGGFKENRCKFFTNEYPEEYLLHAGDLIVTMTDLSKKTDTLGYGSLVPDSPSRVYLHNQRIGRVNTISNQLPKAYIYWFLRSYIYHMRIVGTATGSTVKHTSPGRILEQVIPIPKKESLADISNILQSINDEIAKNNRENIVLANYRDVLLPKLMSGNLDVSYLDS